jgi:hypothetical protein
MNTISYISVSMLLLTNTAYAQEQSQWVEWIADAGVSFPQTENLHFSAFVNDEQNDSRLKLSGYFGRYYQLTSLTRLQFMGLLSVEQFSDFDQMNNRTVGANLGLRHKFGVGFNVPFIKLAVEYQDNQFDANSWDNTMLSARVALGQHFTDRLSASASFEANKMDGGAGPTVVAGLSSAPFDQTFWRASVNMDYLLSQDWMVSAQYTRREGDFDSACTGPNVAIVLDTMKVKAITKDTIFNGCVYQLDGSANIYSMSLSYAVSEHSAMNLDAHFYEGSADVLDYRARSVQLSFNYRY